MDGRSVLVFLHIPRTGGTSFKSMLTEIYGDRGMWIHAPALNAAVLAVRKRLSMSGPPLRAIWGHMPFGIHNHIDLPVEYVSILRDPVENMCSEYWYVKRTKDHYLAPIASFPFEHWLEEAAMSAWDVSNPQTRYFAGLDWVGRTTYPQQPTRGKPLAQTLTPEHAELAKHRLRHEVAIVGVTELLPSFIARCSERFGWSSTPALPELQVSGGVVSSKRPSMRSMLPPHVVARADQLLAHDVSLYAVAKEMSS